MLLMEENTARKWSFKKILTAEEQVVKGINYRIKILQGSDDGLGVRTSEMIVNEIPWEANKMTLISHKETILIPPGPLKKE